MRGGGEGAVLTVSARPDRVQRSVAYFSRTSDSASAISSAASPPAVSSSPCTARKPSASAVMVSSNDGRRPSTASSVVMPASGSRSVGNTRRRRSGAAPSITAPCWRKPAPCRRWALPTTLRPATSSSYEPVRAKQKVGIAVGSEGCTGTISTGAPRRLIPAARAAPIQRYVSSRSPAPSKSPARGRHAVGQLELGPLVEDGAAAGRPAHEPEAERGRRVHVDAIVEGLPVAEGDGGAAARRRSGASEAPCPRAGPAGAPRRAPC